MASLVVWAGEVVLGIAPAPPAARWSTNFASPQQHPAVYDLVRDLGPQRGVCEDARAHAAPRVRAMMEVAGVPAVTRHSYADAEPSGSPRVDRALTLGDGRRVQVAEWGPPDGIPLIFMHGRPESRLFCPDLPVHERAGVRFIAFDRPGYGRSDVRRTVPSYLAATRDLEDVLDRLGLDRIALAGWSAGGPYALAFAAMAPQRVTSLSVICSPSGPESGTSDDPDVTAVEQAVRLDPVARRDQVRARAAWVLQDRTWAVSAVERSDPSVFDAPGMRDMLQGLVDEATAATVEGYVDDWILSALDWPFDLASIEAPTYVWSGERDEIVPPTHAAHLEEGVANSRSFSCADCGHFVLVAHWPQIVRTATST